MTHIAYFISHHGFGHAARAAAVMTAVHAIDPTIHFDVYSDLPAWFFADSLSGPYTFKREQTDIGMVQQTPLQGDLSLTVQALNGFLPFDRFRVEQLADQLLRRRCRLVICDISPLGIAIAQAAGISSVLIENFTWDWIYAGYGPQHTALQGHSRYLRGVFETAAYHIQTEPICRHRPVDLKTPPVSRKPRATRQETRRRLGLSAEAALVLVTMGGIRTEYAFLDSVPVNRDTVFVVPGGSDRPQWHGNILRLPHRSEFYHPDLVQAADAVIGKAGYSTLAEVYHAGIPFGYIARPDFTESPVLTDFIRTTMSGDPVSEADFYRGDWPALADRLLRLPRVQRLEPNGAQQIAAFIHQFIQPASE